MTDSIKDIFNLVEQEIDSVGEYNAIDRLKASGLEHDKACGFVEIIMLKKKNHFSRIAKLKRFFSRTGKDAESIFELICRNLISSGHYESVDGINRKITEIEENYGELESKYNYRDDCYYYSSVVRRKIIILINLHFDDFSDSLKNEATNLIGKEKILNSINQRTQHIKNLK